MCSFYLTHMKTWLYGFLGDIPIILTAYSLAHVMQCNNKKHHSKPQPTVKYFTALRLILWKVVKQVIRPKAFPTTFVFGSNHTNRVDFIKYFQNCVLQLEHKETRRSFPFLLFVPYLTFGTGFHPYVVRNTQKDLR